MSLTRRQLLASAAVLAAPGVVPAIEPIKRTGKPHLRLSLAAYSFRELLNIKIDPPKLTLLDFARMAASYGVDAIEPTAYYFADTSVPALVRLKAHCTRLGLDISGTAVGNDFCHTEKAKLEGQLKMVREWVERCSILGGKTIRIFAGSVKKGDTEEKARVRCVAAIEEACEHAAKFGVILALENHGGITGTAEQLLALVKAVKHDHFGVNLDTGNFHTQNPYADLAALAPYTVVVQVKTEIQPAGKPKEEADLKKLLDILRAVNFRGYVALEYEAREDPLIAVPRHVGELRKLMH